MWAAIQSYIVSSLLKLAGWRAYLANIILKKVGKWLEEFYVGVVNRMMDNKDLHKYADEMAKGKDADEEQKLKDQLDILNPGHKH